MSQNQAPAIVRSPLAQIKGVVESEAVRKSFNEILGRNAPAFISSIISSVSGNPGLQKCDPHSIVRSAGIAATLNLPIIPDLGFAYIVPYKDVATFQVGYKGFIQLGLRSGEYVGMNATPIPDGVIKSHNPITGQFEFDLSKFDKKAPPVGYMFYSKLQAGFERFNYMSKEECFDHGKRYSQSFKKGFGVWVDNFDAMAIKTVIKQDLRRWGKLTIDLQTAVVYDQAEVLEGGGVRYPDSPETPPTPGESAERLAELQAAKDELIPDLKPPQTPKQFFDECMANPSAGKLHVETMIKMLNDKGHTTHALKLQALLEGK